MQRQIFFKILNKEVWAVLQSEELLRQLKLYGKTPVCWACDMWHKTWAESCEYQSNEKWK